MKKHLKTLIGSLTFICIGLAVFTCSGQVKMLKEVNVKKERPVIQKKADRIIYDLKADPESKGNNMLMMMRKVPYLSVDGDDNLLLKGNSSFKVLIDGKPSASMENNLKAVLKSMPASTIDRIEVITIPPSKYDAEGLAGIINIITNKRINDGYTATLNINESGPAGGPGVGTSISAKYGKLGISANAGGSINNTPETRNSSYRLSTADQPIVLDQHGYQKLNTRTAYLITALSYQVDSLNLISAQLNYNASRDHTESGQSSIMTGGSNQQYSFVNDGKATANGTEAGINYELGFKAKKNQLLTLSYLYSTNGPKRGSNITFDQQMNFNTPDFRQNNNQRFKEHSFQVDFSTPIKNVNIEGGLKGILRKNTSDFDYSYFNASVNQFEQDNGLSNEYTNTQNVFSAYNSYQISLGSWNINAGARLEGTKIDAEFTSTATTAEQSYFNLVPSIALNKRFKNESSLNMGFSQRIRRPGINRLNPYIDRSNPNYEITGNPYLRPVVLNDIQLGYGINKKISVNLGLDYSFINNLDLQVINFDPVAQVSRITYANTGKSSSLGLNFNFGYAAGIYRASLNGNAMYLWLAGEVDGVKVNNNLLMYSSTLSNVIRLNRGWALNADFSVNSHSPTGLQGRTNGFFYTAFNFNKEIIKDRFGIAGGIKNPFTKYRNFVNQTSGPGFIQVYRTNNYFRSFNISLNYKFGGLKDEIRRNRVGIDNNDLSN